MKGSIYLRKTNDPHWVVSWPDGKKRYKITHYLGEPDLMYQTNQNKKHDTGYKKAEKLLALMQGDVERNCFRIEKYTGGRLTDPEEARKAVDELIEAVREQARAWLVEHPDSECHAKNSARVAAARAALTGE